MFFLIFSIVGFLVFLFGLWSYRLAKASTQWKKYEARVLDTAHVVSRDSRAENRVDRLHVDYQYKVDGVEYQNDRVSFRWTYRNVPDDQKKYVKGQRVNVYVNPDDPEQAVLEPGVDRSSYLSMFTGLAFVLIGFVLAFIA